MRHAKKNRVFHILLQIVRTGPDCITQPGLFVYNEKTVYSNCYKLFFV